MVRLIAVVALALTITSPLPADAQGRGRGFGPFGSLAPGAARTDQEPAFARGYADGYEHARDDRENRKGYDPVTHREYREADQGFYRSYGSRDAYKDNYRAGFRAGYDAGYREPASRQR